MNGEIAQFVALACHANAALAGRQTTLSGNSAFQFCKSISFVALETTKAGHIKEVAIASTPDGWLLRLRQMEVRGVRLAHQPGPDPTLPDRMTAAFVGGGGTWSLEVLRRDGMTETWLARWQATDSNSPDRRVWSVTYGLVTTFAMAAVARADLAAVTDTLRVALVNIHAFSQQHRRDPFTDMFDKALNCLADPRQWPGYHRDLHVEGMLPDEAVTLLHAVQHAWVFAGMGSWNDMGFDGEAQTAYDRVSNDLFNAVQGAILAAANSSLPSGI
jgi:hypothetical protein